MPVILRRLEKEEYSLEKNRSHQSSIDTKTKKMMQILTMIFIRPIRMFAEPLVLFTDIFLLYQYSILYLYFEAYPIIFKGKPAQYPGGKQADAVSKGTYGMTSGESACMLLPSKFLPRYLADVHSLLCPSRSGGSHLSLRVPLVRSIPPEKQDAGKDLGTERRVSSFATSLRRRAALCDFIVLAC